MKPKGFSRAQIILHWTVFVLVALQFIFNDYIKEAWYTYVKTGEFQFNLLIAGHVVGGIVILLLVLWRLALRKSHGVPPLPESDSPAQKAIAAGTQHSLYLLLIVMPLTGLAAWFGDVQVAATAHFYLKFLLIALIALHFVAALYHQYVLRDGLLDQMIKPEK